jgi:hypothetical protein
MRGQHVPGKKVVRAFMTRTPEVAHADSCPEQLFARTVNTLHDCALQLRTQSSNPLATAARRMLGGASDHRPS